MSGKFERILLVYLMGVASSLHAQSTLDLIRKIKVDDDGAAGACDGCAFNRAGDMLAASDNSGYAKHRIDFGVNRVKSVRFSPDMKYFAVSGQKIRIWRVFHRRHGSGPRGGIPADRR